jgi:hypothetical protein
MIQNFFIHCIIQYVHIVLVLKYSKSKENNKINNIYLISKKIITNIKNGRYPSETE